MGFSDRDYYRDAPPPSGFGRVGHWLLFGRVPLFTAFGIRVQAHSSLVITMGLTLLIGLPGQGYVWQDRVIGAIALFVIVLLHEFGHCFGARLMGGEAEEIVMHPLGGLALARPPFNWWANFVTVAAGPLVNVALCVVCGAVLYAYSGRIPWKPFYVTPWEPFGGWGDLAWWCYWLYQTNWTLLLFNLMPIFPLDGGQLTQSVLWKFMGYFRATLIACTIGMVGAAVGGMVALATLSLWLLVLCALGFYHCLQVKRMTLEAGPYAFSAMEYDAGGPSWRGGGSSGTSADRRERRAAEKAMRQKYRQRVADEAEERRVDELLAKISASGKDSLTWSERRFLRKATEHKRQRDADRPPPNAGRRSPTNR